MEEYCLIIIDILLKQQRTFVYILIIIHFIYITDIIHLKHIFI